MRNKFDRFTDSVENSIKTLILATTLTMLVPSVTHWYKQKVVDILNKWDWEKISKSSDIQKPNIENLMSR